MKCGHCSADVPPQWVHALNTNTCPSCGGTLMSDTEISLLSELREAMNDMPNNPEGIAGWLLSHYQLVKTGSGEAAQFNQPMIQGAGGGVPGGLVHQKNGAVVGQRIPQPESPVATINKFLARANVKPKSKAEMEAALSRSEGGGGNAALIAAWNSDNDAGGGGGEPMDDQVAVYANALAGGGGMGGMGGMGGGDDGDAAHDAIVNAFAGMGAGGVVPGLPGAGGRPTGADMLAGIKAMQRKQVNQEMRATGSVGKINRAG